MKSPRVCCCLLTFFCYILLTGCHKTDHKVAPPPGPTATTTVTLSKVSSTVCTANPDPVPISSGDTVIFQPDSNTYLVTFLPTATPNGPTVPVASNPFRVGGTSIPQIMRGPSNCNATGCDYKYKMNYIVGGVTQQPPCADPVIHIKPQSVANDQR